MVAMSEPGSEIAVAPVAGGLGPVPRDEWMSVVEQATRIAGTKIVPEIFRGKPDELIAVALLSREVGRGLMWGLRYVYISRDGKTAMHAEGMLGLMRSAGVEVWPIETTSQVARVGWKRGAREGEISYTIEEAVAAGLCELKEGKPHSRSQKGYALPWEKHTPDMLWARVISRTGRRIASDVLGGMSYVPEEIGARVDPETGEVHAPDVETVTVEKARELRARISDLSPEMKQALKARFSEMGAIIASGKDTEESPLVPMLPESWLERVETEIAGVEEWEPRKPPVDDDEVAEGEIVGEESSGPIPMDEPRKPPLQIVQNDPRHAGNVRRTKPVAFNWHWSVDHATSEETAVCNACTHPCNVHGGLGASGGCARCACKIVEWTPIEGESSSPANLPGEGDPAVGEAVNETSSRKPTSEGSPSAPPEPSSAPTARGVGPGPDRAVNPTAADPGPLPNKLTESQRRGIHAACKENGLDDDARHAIVEFLTGSRTTSSTEITVDEASQMLNLIGQVKTGALGVGEHDGAVRVHALNDRGVKFLRAIERGIVPAAGRSGILRDDDPSGIVAEDDAGEEF